LSLYTVDRRLDPRSHYQPKWRRGGGQIAGDPHLGRSRSDFLFRRYDRRFGYGRGGREVWPKGRFARVQRAGDRVGRAPR